MAKQQAEEKRIRQEEAQAQAEKIRLAQIEKAKAAKLATVQAAEAVAETKRLEQAIQAKNEAEKQALEKQRQEELAAAKAQAEAIRKEQAEAQKALLAKKEQERLQQEEALAIQQAEEKRIRQEEAQAQAEKIRLAQIEKANTAKLEAIRLAEKEEEAQAQADEIRIAEEKASLARIEASRLEEERLVKEKEEDNNIVVDAKSGKCSVNIKGSIKNPLNNKGIAGATVDIYYEGQNIESTLSDETGTFYFHNSDCNTTYTIVSYKPEIDDFAKLAIDTGNLPKEIALFLEPEVPVVTDKETVVASKIETVENNNVETDNAAKEIDTSEKEETALIQPKEEVIEAPKIFNGKVVLNPIYFDLDEYYLTLSARRELDKIIVLMHQRPTMIIESGSHTDTRGPFDYNLELSEKRSQQTVGYLVANGVDPDRISGRGYGESMPLNHCVEGVKCSEEEHLINRRTEFVILRE